MLPRPLKISATAPIERVALPVSVAVFSDSPERSRTTASRRA